MRSLWKVGVKPVVKVSDKLVGSFPQLPHSRVGNIEVARVIPTASGVFQDFVRIFHTALSTAENRISLGEIGDLYTLSTEPTITTTIYINRRGAAQ